MAFKAQDKVINIMYIYKYLTTLRAEGTTTLNKYGNLSGIDLFPSMSLSLE